MDKIYALQLVNYFINNGYSQITIFTNEKVEKDGFEYWLYSRTNKQYLAIHISDESMSARSANRMLKLETVKKLREFGNSEGTLLDINLNLNSNDDTIDGFIYFAYKQVGVFPEYITNQFVGLDKYCYEVSDAKKEEKNVRKQIHRHNYNSSRKAKPFFGLKDSTLMFKIVSAICILIWCIITAVKQSSDIADTSIAIVLGAYYKSFITVLHEYWRFLTYGFVHIDIFHIICNLLSFKSLSEVCEKLYGPLKSWIILIVSIIVGGLFSFIGQGNIVIVGLSGGIYGLLGAVGVQYIISGALKDKAVVRSILKDLYMNVLITLLFSTAWLAHIGGFIAGLFLGFILNKENFYGLKTHFTICGVILTLVLGYMGYNKANFTDYYYGTDLQVADIVTKIGLTDYAERIVTDTFIYYMGD